MGKKKFSDLDAITASGLNDLLATSKVDAQAETGYTSKKITVGNVAKSINGDFEYNTELPNFNNKTIVGALNEIHNGVYLYKENETPYQYRPTPLTANRTLEKLIGCSCAFNQLVQNSGISFTSTSTDTRDIFALRIREINSPYTLLFLENLTTPKHIQTIVNATASFTGLMLYHDGSQSNIIGYSDNAFNVISGHKYLLNIDVTGADVSTVGGVSYDDFNLIDLTALFGSSEVADYFYNLETQTAGAGVAKFRQLFPESYYAYQTATLISAKPVAKKVVGKNLFDEDTILQYYNFTKESDGSFYSNSFNSILNESLWENNIGYDGTIYLDYDYKYQNSTGSAGIRFSIEYEDGYISASSPSLVSTFTHFQRVSLSGHGKVKRIFFDYGTSNNATWLKNVSVTFEDSDYEPYEEHTYPLGSDEIRGIFKIENGELVAYGDVHNSDGTGVKYFGIVDLGSLDWDYQGNNRFTPVQDIGAKIQSSTTVVANILCDTYTTVAQGGIAQDKIIAGLNWGNGIIIHDTDYSDTTDFKTAMSGKYLIYELATPTSETYTAFSNPMLCGSTEEFTDSRTVKMPCGHDSLYYTSNFKYW